MSAYDHEQGAARETLCRLLAACYYQPGPEFAEERVFDTLCAAAGRLDARTAVLASRLRDGFAAIEPEPLLVEYTRLFLGPIDAPAAPYGSVWLGGEGALMRDSTMAVVALYHEGGFELAGDFRNLPDHVAAELEFLYLSIYRENEAQRNADLDALAVTLDLRRRFLGAHLGAWIEPFTAAIERAARTEHYRALAALTRHFVQNESRDVR